MANDQVSVDITLEEKQALRALTALTKGIESFEKSAVKSVKKSDKAFDSFKGNLAAIATSGAIKAIASGLTELVGASLQAAASTEKIQTQLEVLTGSQEKAAQLFKELTEFSATTPFQLQGIAEASAQLLSFGFEASTVQARIAKIGEVAAGSGSDLKEVALIYGQVAAAGKLTGERLLQLQERAIPIGAALANSLGVAESEVKDLVSSGVVGFNEFEKAFNSLSESGGLFEGAIKKQSETINGVLSTLGDNFFILQSKIGEAFAPNLIQGAKVITESLQELTQVLIDNRSVVEAGIGFITDYISVYSNLAAQVVGTKTELQKIDDQIASLSDRQQKAKQTADEARNSMGEYFGIFDSDKAFSIKESEKNIAALETQITSLLEKRKALISQDQQQETTDTTQSPRVKQEETANATILAKRAEFQTQLSALEAEKAIKDQELILAKTDLTAQQREEELNSLVAFQNAKVDVELNAQLEKNKKIRDADAKALADKAAYLKADIAQQQNTARVEQQINALRVQSREKMVQGFGVALTQAASLAKKGTQEQKLLAIAAATINTYAAATRAYRDYPYPAN